MNAGRWPPLRWWSASIVLVGVGLTASIYLLGRVFAMLEPSRSATPDLCSILFSTGCDGALADDRFWILNVPLAGWGLVYFSTLAGLLLLARFVEGAFETHALFAGSTLALAGVGAGVALTASALLGRAPICPLCVAIHAVSLALLFTLQRAIGRPVSDQIRLVRDGLARLLRPGAAAPEAVRWQLVGFGCIALVAAMAYQWVFVESALRRPASEKPPDRAEVIASYRASPELTLPVSGQDPHLGPLAAPVQLVVFESFRCPHCQRFAATLSRVQREFGDRLLVVFKHYPLSTQCNSRLARDLQPEACEIAWAAEAAHRQERFWQFHDAVLAAGTNATAETIARTVRRLGLDPVRFESDRRSAAVRERVAEDVALGNRLKLPGTPATFLDGRLVRSATPERLEILVRHELGVKAARAVPGARAAKELGRPGLAGRPPVDG